MPALTDLRIQDPWQTELCRLVSVCHRAAYDYFLSLKRLKTSGVVASWVWTSAEPGVEAHRKSVVGLCESLFLVCENGAALCDHDDSLKEYLARHGSATAVPGSASPRFWFSPSVMEMDRNLLLSYVDSDCSSEGEQTVLKGIADRYSQSANTHGVEGYFVWCDQLLKFYVEHLGAAIRKADAAARSQLARF